MLALAPSGSLAARYLSLNNWDSFHYQKIAEIGYVLPASGVITSDSIHRGLANVVFFPGYPLAARAMAWTLSLPIAWALPLVAQLAAFLFWFYFMLYLRERGVGRGRLLSSAVVIALHPAAFYLVTGYTESLFLASMMGFIYWNDRSRKSGATLIAAAHGLAMSATRIVSFAPAAYPFFKSGQWRAPFRSRREVFLGLAGISGGLAFFIYCQLHFGRWNVYFDLEQIGWGNERQWFAILNPLSYVPHFFFENSWDSLNRLAVTWTAAHLIVCALAQRGKGTPGVWPLWFTAFILFYIPMTGKASAHLESMLRYTLPVTILLLAAQAMQSPGRSIFKRWPRLTTVIATLSFAVQLWCAYRFLRGRWIA